MIDVGQIKERWNHLHRVKSLVRTRAEQCAALTLPSVMPPEGHTEGSELPQPFQALGAKAVNNLASKILLALFPPNTSFFKINFDESTQRELEEDGSDLDAIANDLALIEREVVTELEQTKLRPVLNLALRHLLITGNYVIDILPSMNFRGFGLRHFAVNRDPEGNVLELVIREEVSPLTLSDEVKAACIDPQPGENKQDPDETIEVYTAMYRHNGKYHVRQEINNREVPKSTGTFPLDAPRFVVLRWSAITDEDYGRGMVDEYFGDLKALDDLSRDLLLASSIAAKVIFTVKPNSHIKQTKLANAQSGDVLQGDSEDVGTVSLDKLGDFNIVLERLRDIQKDLAEAFLMHSSIQRDAERVTAEEIRFMAQELEDALGGVYSVLSQELQAPLVRRVLSLLSKKDAIPKLPSTIRLSITTGLDALGRGHDVNKIMQFFQIAVQFIPQEALMTRIKSQDVLAKVAASMGLDSTELLYTDQEVQTQMQQQQIQSTVADAAPGVAQELIRQGGTNG